MNLSLVLPLLGLVAGLALLIWSADRFIEGAAAIADRAGMSPLLVGMLIVGFGTSAPEMVVSAMAAADGRPDLALGNVLGSNITNTGLILGLAALIAPMMVQSNIIRRELPLLLVISLAAGVLLYDSVLTRREAGGLLLGFLAIVAWTLYTGLRNRGDHFGDEVQQELTAHRMSRTRALLSLVVGLALLVASSRILVLSAVTIAEGLGVSELVIGLTIVALGTSLPELAASLIAARRGEHDIAIGNVVGSNMFNLLAVLGIAGVIEPLVSIPAGVFLRDYVTMLALTVALLFMALGPIGARCISRREGGLLLAAYVGYTGLLVARVA